VWNQVLVRDRGLGEVAGVVVGKLGEAAGAFARGEGLGVLGLDQAEAAELAVLRVVVAVAVAVASDQPGAGDGVPRVDPVEDLHREGELGGPRAAGALVAQVMGGAAAIAEGPGEPHAVVDRGEQVGLGGAEGGGVAQGARVALRAALPRSGWPCRCRAGP
jgi:hypothetical protein